MIIKKHLALEMKYAHVTDKSPFFIGPYPVREEDKAFIDKEMK